MCWRGRLGGGLGLAFGLSCCFGLSFRALAWLVRHHQIPLLKIVI